MNVCLKKKPLFFIVSISFLITAAILFAYFQDTDTRSADETIHDGGTLKVACTEKILTLDPQKAESASEQRIIDQIYDGLVEYDKNDQIVPVLAQSMPEKVGEYGYVLQLRQDLEFHDRTSLDANDVVYTVKRLLDPGTQSPARQIFQSIRSAEALSTYTIKFNVEADCPDLLELLARLQMRPVSMEAVKKYGDGYGKIHIVGTGPFRLVEWDRDNQVILERNYSYKLKNPPPHLHKIVFTFPKPDLNQLRELRYGRIELIPELSPRLASELAKRSYARIEHKPGQRICQIYLNTDRPPFDRYNIRKAVSFGINRRQITEQVFYGFADQAGSCLPSWHRFFDEDSEKQYFDPKIALMLLAQEGFSSDFPLSFSLMYTNIEPFREIAQLIQQQLSFINIQVFLIPLGKKELFDYVYGRAQTDRNFFQAALEDWEDWRGGGGADQFTWRLYHHSSSENKLGMQIYPWEEYLNRASKECNSDIRELLYRRSVAMIDKEIVTIYLCYPHRIWAARSWVNGGFCNSLGNLFLEDVWVR